MRTQSDIINDIVKIAELNGAKIVPNSRHMLTMHFATFMTYVDIAEFEMVQVSFHKDDIDPDYIDLLPLSYSDGLRACRPYLLDPETSDEMYEKVIDDLSNVMYMLTLNTVLKA